MATGRVVEENGTAIVLQGGSRFRPGDVVERSVLKISTMPPLAGVLPVEKIRDLVAYLNSLK